METLFEIRSPMPFQSEKFILLKKKAETLLKERNQGAYCQAIVVLTANGQEYGIAIENALSSEKSEEKQLIEILTEKNDTAVSHLLCMWGSGDIDIPSMHFRKLLLALDPQNKHTGMFVKTREGYSVFPLKSSMP